MDTYNHDNGSGIFVQVGAGAGDLDTRANCRDGFTEFIKGLPRERINKIILVEPNPFNIPKLRECWKEYPESEIHEIGIVPSVYKDDVIKFYYCPSDAPHYQVASINKAHIQKHYGGSCELKEHDIKVKYLNDFINEVVDGQIELLSLDIEGIDAEVLLDVDLTKLNVKYISFEHLHLGNKKTQVMNRLENHGFTFKGKGVDHNGYDYLYVQKF